MFGLVVIMVGGGSLGSGAVLGRTDWKYCALFWMSLYSCGGSSSVVIWKLSPSMFVMRRQIQIQAHRGDHASDIISLLLRYHIISRTLHGVHDAINSSRERHHRI